MFEPEREDREHPLPAGWYFDKQKAKPEAARMASLTQCLCVFVVDSCGVCVRHSGPGRGGPQRGLFNLCPVAPPQRSFSWDAQAEEVRLGSDPGCRSKGLKESSNHVHAARPDHGSLFRPSSLASKLQRKFLLFAMLYELRKSPAGSG